LLDSFRPGETDVLAASNREFLNHFIQGTGDQAELLSADGYNAPGQSASEKAGTDARLVTEFVSLRQLGYFSL
jgi:hypothetical protein